MMSDFKQGERVFDKYLWAGVIFAVVYSFDSAKPFGYSVLFDKTPDKRYNGGENPCLMLEDSLTKGESDE